MLGHVTPEAMSGGPIAAVENGDVITIDVANKTLTLVRKQSKSGEKKRA